MNIYKVRVHHSDATLHSERELVIEHKGMLHLMDVAKALPGGGMTLYPGDVIRIEVTHGAKS